MTTQKAVAWILTGLFIGTSMAAGVYTSRTVYKFFAPYVVYSMNQVRNNDIKVVELRQTFLRFSQEPERSYPVERFLWLHLFVGLSFLIVAGVVLALLARISLHFTATRPQLHRELLELLGHLASDEREGFPRP